MRIALVLTSALTLAVAPAMAGDKTGEAKTKGADTLTGCLSKSTASTTGTATAATDAYVLTTKNKEIDVRGTQLAEHVGHEVKLTGSWMNEAAHGGAASATADKQQTRTDKGSPRHFMVSEIQHISETCTTKADMKQQKKETKQETQQEKQDTKPQKQY